MTYREILIRFKSDLSKFDPDELILVHYDKVNHNLQFSQLNHTFIASYLSPLFLPKKGFKLGVLNQFGFNRLMVDLTKLTKDNLLDDLVYIPDLQELGTDWYRTFTHNSITSPRKVYSLKYVNITNRFLTWFLCKFYNPKSKLLYESAQ